eukprot:TRINITY_DN132_c1_g2_i2.p1 TRINITY_DN132_c1_g2~~TRINITY_DN132_c1_g2_i2.p1  ORF type:complete len:663 (-),score=151.83 TRINITY_DN132_c1_g2_i2:123-2081(-)
MSVAGIDFGVTTSVVAIARRRGIDICANEVSKRETASLVAFTSKQRHIGEPAASQQQSNLRNTISNFKRLIGRKYNDPEVQREIAGLPFVVVEGKDGSPAFKVDFGGEERIFSCEQITGMMLYCLRNIAQLEAGGTRIVDAVIAVPAWFTDAQRRSMLDAASIAGFNTLSLVNEMTAAAISWGMPKTDLPEDVPTNVVFVDIGHTTTSLAAVSFTKKKMTVLGSVCERNFGGRNFDVALVNHFAEQAKVKLGVDLRARPRSLFRLEVAASKIKHILSANLQAQITVECIHEDFDFTLRMDRPEFEALIAPLLEELAAPCQLLLKQTGLAADALSAVEVIGGSSRVPAVKTTLTQVFGRELSWTLNTSESIARGCGLLGAVLSPAFMVKEFEIHDTSMYAINLSWRANSASVADMDVDGSDNASQMFTVNNAVPSVKQITFPRADSYELVATYAEPSQVPGGVGATVATFQLPEVPAPSSAENKSKVKVKVRLNWFGVVAVDGAQLVEELPEEETPAAAGADGKPVEKKVKVRRVDINVVTRATGGRTRDEIKHMTEEERAMELRDQEVAATADAKNAVESYVYDMRNKLTSNLQAFIAADDRTKFSALMDQTESWLYDEGDDTTKDVYMAKLQSLKVRTLVFLRLPSKDVAA